MLAVLAYIILNIFPAIENTNIQDKRLTTDALVQQHHTQGSVVVTKRVNHNYHIFIIQQKLPCLKKNKQKKTQHILNSVDWQCFL